MNIPEQSFYDELQKIAKGIPIVRMKFLRKLRAAKRSAYRSDVPGREEVAKQTIKRLVLGVLTPMVENLQALANLVKPVN